MAKVDKDFNTVVKSVLKNSMLTGIPQIATARNSSKKMSRAFIFVICMAGFIYQSKVFFDLYWQYKVLMDVQVTSEEYTRMPSITVCNYNGMQTSRLCRLKPSICKPYEELQERYQRLACYCTDRYCYENGTLKSNFSEYLANNFGRSQVEDLQDFVQPADELIYHCYWSGITSGYDEWIYCNVSDVVSIRARASAGHSGNVCYTLNSLIHHPDDTIGKVRSTGFITMALNANATEYLVDYPVEEVGIVDISFHNPYTVVNPYTSGYSLRHNKAYTFRLEKIVRKSLPAPYETNCTDYMTLWKMRGGYGPTNQQECAQECFLNVSLAKHGCAPSTIDWPHNHAICDIYIYTHPLYVQAEQCINRHCQQACYEETYEVDMQAVDDLPYTGKRCGTRYQRDRFSDYLINVKIQLNRMQVTTYSAKAQYEDIEAFSYLGGYVGMWLGISLLAVFDFLEAMYVILRYPLEHKCKKQKSRTNMHQVFPSPDANRF